MQRNMKMKLIFILTFKESLVEYENEFQIRRSTS